MEDVGLDCSRNDWVFVDLIFWVSKTPGQEHFLNFDSNTFSDFEHTNSHG